ncbi:MAG: hypothetical protein PHF74_03935 [Dehalococcoidales bacterium]|nr:hypothetical protein [Dehalococcoidales bacterium]
MKRLLFCSISFLLLAVLVLTGCTETKYVNQTILSTVTLVSEHTYTVTHTIVSTQTISLYNTTTQTMASTNTSVTSITTTTNTTYDENNIKSIDDLIIFFISRGLSVEGKNEKNYQLIGAADGCGLIISGEAIEIYRYDLDDPGQNTIITNAKNSNTISFWGLTFPCYVNGSFLLVNYYDNLNKDAIIAAFTSFHSYQT